MGKNWMANVTRKPYAASLYPAFLKLTLLILLCLAWLLPGLIGHEPWKPDEAYSFGVVHHIFQSGEWVVPTLAGEPFMEKPPLYYLTAAGFAHLFSAWLPMHDAARLASAFYMALTLLFTGLAGRELWGAGYGRLSVLVLIGCLGLLVHAHEMITDLALLAGFAMALYGLALGRRRVIPAALLLGTGIGAAFLSKGVVEAAILFLIALLLPLLFRAWRHGQYALCLLLALAAALPWLAIWPVALHRQAPELFWQWWEQENWSRLLELARFEFGRERGYYLKTLPWFTWPALPLAAWTLWQGRARGLAEPAAQLALLALAIMLAALALAPDARDVYALPLLLPLSLLAAKGVDTLRRGAASALDWFGMITFGLICGMLWLGWVALLTGHPAQLAAELERFQPGFSAVFDPRTFFAALAFSLIWLVAVSRTNRVNRRAVTNWALGVTLMWWLLATLWLPWIDAGKSYRSMVTAIQRSLPGSYRCIASLNLGEPQRALLEYYAGIRTQRMEVSGRPMCDLLLVQGNTLEEIEVDAAWQLIWEGARPGDRRERFRLYQRRKEAPA